MEITLSPELERHVHEAVQRGSYATPNDFVAHAVKLLHEQEAELAAARAELVAKLEAGWASIQRGDFYTEDQVRAGMAQRKQEWLESRQSVA